MELFHVVDDTFVIVRTKGVFRQAKVYRRGDKVYAGWGNGFILLLGSGGTSHTDTSWEAPTNYGDLHKSITQGPLKIPQWKGA